MLLFFVINVHFFPSILPTNYLVIIQTFSLEKYGASHAHKRLYVIYHIRYLFFMVLSFPFSLHCLEHQSWKTNTSALGIVNP